MSLLSYKFYISIYILIIVLSAESIL